MKPDVWQRDAADFVYERDSSTPFTERRGRWPRPGTLKQRIEWRTKKSVGCWEWTAHKSPRGYALIWWNKRTWRVSRVVWMLANGPIPPDRCVLHKCDNPACVRLTHLFLGTHADNAADRNRKKRHAHGERISCAKLTAAKVRYIRRVAIPATKLAKRFGVAISSVCNARNGATWKHL